jgi:redox-sensing transcriptional repressor
VPALPDLPEATVARLPEYLRALHNLAETGHDTVSSEELAGAAGVNSAKLRKDLSQLGSYGTRGVGYDVALLIDQIEFVLGLTQRRAVALVGVGNLGHALAGYAGFASRGFRIAALFDADSDRVGEEINGLVVQHIDELPRVAVQERLAIGVIATPATAAQSVADQLVAVGVTSILNFAPCVLAVPDGVDVRKVDLAIELQILSFHEHRKAALTDLPAASGSGLPPAGGRLTSANGVSGGSTGAGLTALPGGLAATGTTQAAPTGSLRSTNAEAVGS